jgi:hypothetical protein
LDKATRGVIHLGAVEAAAKTPVAKIPVELSIAGWFVLVAALVELCLGRIAALLGVYLGVGQTGPLAWLANAGELAMYAAGLASLGLILFVLSSIIGNRRLPGGWWRAMVILVSPVYLLVAGLAAFEPLLSSWLLVGAYFAAILTALIVSGVAVALPIGGGPRRVVLALGVANLLQVFGWAALDYFEADREGVLGAVAIRAYLVAEAIWVLAPVAAFFGLVADSPRKAGLFLRRPHVPALIIAVTVTAGATAIVARTVGHGSHLAQIAYLALGVTLSVPGAPWVNLVSLFFAALTAAALVLPDPRHPIDACSRRVGFGLTLVWVAGLQPYRVFQFALMLLGFALVARGVLGRVPGVEEPQDGFADALRGLDAAAAAKGRDHGSASRC